MAWKKKILPIVMAGSMVLALSACASKQEVMRESSPQWNEFSIVSENIPEDKKETELYIACYINNLESPYMQNVMQGVNKFAEYLKSTGQRYKLQILDAATQGGKELRRFARNADGNLIVYIDAASEKETEKLVDMVLEHGGYAATVWKKEKDVKPNDYGERWVTHTMPDEITAGQKTAEALIKKIGKKGKIFVLEGMLGSPENDARIEGLEKALEKYPEVEVLYRDTANDDLQEAKSLMEDWLKKAKNVDGIWCANDQMALGALQALEALELKGKVPVTAFGAGPEMLEEIKNGNILATTSPNGMAQSGYALSACYAAWAEVMKPQRLPDGYRDFYTKPIIITADTLQKYQEKYVDAVPEYDYSKVFDQRVHSR